ncbi:hypothetical protein F7734_48960 [Scytonema sp. UIC 10036]|uniref:hypothetical protein n=1 Tax=Scytonema sp. UIC 10036 TaxID=2304196 RepID=UPI0012DA7CA6|nr:hypothetical protein [Scytonema sp. UIC 10036]MUG99789.1 hypothetical protein [Scytonema sp. UIC 10036]
MPKPVLKDAQLSVRISSEILEKMKQEASELNLSMADFVLKLYQEHQSKEDLEERVRALERAVFQQSNAA